MPPFGQAGLDKGYDAETAISIRRAVKKGATAEGVTAITGAGDKACGVSLFGVTLAEVARGKGASVRRTGIAEWEAGAAVAKDVAVSIDATGRCILAVSGARVYGTTEQAAAAAGEVIAVAVNFINPPILA